MTISSIGFQNETFCYAQTKSESQFGTIKAGNVKFSYFPTSPVKADLLERMFRAIATDDEVAVDKLLVAIIKEERRKGHIVLAERLENIAKSKSNTASDLPVAETSKPTRQTNPNTFTKLQSLTELPTSKRSQLPLVTVIKSEHLRHHTILAEAVEKRFQRIEREYAARDRLAHYGFTYKQKILLYGLPGCGKTMSAERLAWNTGLPLLKVRFDAMVSSYLGETASNLREIFEVATKNPCLLFLDECDTLAKSREDNNEVGEIKRVVNTFLQILDEYSVSSGLLVAATNLNKSLDLALWRRFDDAIEVPMPTEVELEALLKQTLITMEKGAIDWHLIVRQMKGFSAAQAVRVAQDAAKRAILDREDLVIQPHLEEVIREISAAI
jgi:SpoVK/Ycf46/Vps4 family AAA+-type ATPase